jgi:carbon starvation protein
MLRSSCCRWLFVATTTSTTAYYEISGKFRNMIKAGYVVKGWLNIGLTVMLLVCVAVILGSAVLRWLSPAKTDVVSNKSG